MPPPGAKPKPDGQAVTRHAQMLDWLDLLVALKTDAVSLEVERVVEEPRQSPTRSP